MMLTVALAFIALAVAAITTNQPIPLDQRRCPIDEPASASTVVIADLSDAPLASQGQTLRQVVVREGDAMPEHGRLTLLTVNAQSPYEPQEHLSLCAPLSERKANIMIRTPQRVARQWRRTFGEPVERAAAAAAETPASKASPLIEAITAAGWRPDWSANQRRRRLVIVSDLMQHDPHGFSLYTADAAGFANSTLARMAKPDLSGVDVEIVLLRRPDYLARQAVVAEPFWVAWLTARGAAGVRFHGESHARRAAQQVLTTLEPANFPRA